MKADEAHQLLEHGTTGIIVIIILVLLVPIVGALVYQLATTKRERERMMDRYEKALQAQSELNRKEREEMATRYEGLVGKLIEVSQASVTAIFRMANRLESMPCLMGSHLANGEEKQP